jgi:hypothetical protein
MLKKSLAIFALAAVAFLAVPAPANAIAPYPPAGPCASVTGIPAPGATVTVDFHDGCFTPDEQYDVTVTGQGTVTLAAVNAATATIRNTATSTGAGSLQVTFPQDANGSYVVNAVGITSQRTCSVRMDVVSSSTAVATPTVPLASLASTGSEFPTLALVGAGGLIVIGAAITIVLARRSRSAVKRSA